MTFTTPPPKERAPFPVETFTGTCPNCDALGTVQSVCLTTHVWDGAQVNDAGLLSFEGGFEFLDDSVDAHISCYECDAEWAEPERIEYR